MPGNTGSNMNRDRRDPSDAHAVAPDRELATMTIVELAHLLASRKITSRQLVEQSLAAIADPQGRFARVPAGHEQAAGSRRSRGCAASRRRCSCLPSPAFRCR
jgi:hypothetical protein